MIIDKPKILPLSIVLKTKAVTVYVNGIVAFSSRYNITNLYARGKENTPIHRDHV